MSVGIDGQPADDDEPHPRIIKRLHDRLKAGEFHLMARPEGKSEAEIA